MDHSSPAVHRSSSLSLASSLERMELEHDEDENDYEPSFDNDGSDHEIGEADAEYGEHHQLFGGATSSRRRRSRRGGEDDGDGLDIIQSEYCCSRYLPRSYVGRLVVVISLACNIFFLVRSFSPQSTGRGNGGGSSSGMPMLVSTNDDFDGLEMENELLSNPDRLNHGKKAKDKSKSQSPNKKDDESPPAICEKNDAPCATVLSTFPNSGTTWTQAVFKASTGIVSLAVYPEGPLSPFPPHSYVHGNVGPNARLPDPADGECLFVKTHHRVPYELLADNHPEQIYHRAVVLYRDPEDNLHANLRYLTKLRNDAKMELLDACSYDPSGRPLAVDTEFENWAVINGTDYADFVELHRSSHRRFYCHAERYPAPKMMVTYARLLSDPYNTFRDIMMFAGYAGADIDRALAENPPRSHEVHGSLDYVPVDVEDDGEENEEGDPCARLTRQFQQLWSRASPCAKRAAKILQFI